MADESLAKIDARWSPPAGWNYSTMRAEVNIGAVGTSSGCRQMITTGSLIEQCGQPVNDGVCDSGHPA